MENVAVSPSQGSIAFVRAVQLNVSARDYCAVADLGAEGFGCY